MEKPEVDVAYTSQKTMCREKKLAIDLQFPLRHGTMEV